MLPAMLQIDGKVMKITSLYQSNRVCVFVCVCAVCAVCVCVCLVQNLEIPAESNGARFDWITRWRPDQSRLYQTISKKMTGGNSLINYINLIYSCSFTLCTLSRFVNFGCWDSNRRCFLHWQFPWPRDLLRRTEQAETLIFLRDMPRSVNSVSSYCMCCNDIKCISSAPTRSD